MEIMIKWWLGWSNGWMDGHIVELFDAQVVLLLVNNVLICVGVLKITKLHMYFYKTNVKLY